MDGGAVTVVPITGALPSPDDVDSRLRQVRGLLKKLHDDEKELARVDRYYTGDQPLEFLAPEIRAQVGDRLTSLAVNWPRTIVDSVHRRLHVEGFRVGPDGAAADDLWDIWKANDLTEWSGLLHLDALVHGRGFLSVWANPEVPDYPLIAVESAHQVAVDYLPGDPQRRLRSAVKLWQDGDERFATLYLPDRLVKYRAPANSTLSPVPRWRRYDELPNPLGVVPIVPVVNRSRVLNLNGESELSDVIPLADAVNKLATDMMVASEFSAMPRRWATGLEIPSDPGDRDRFRAEVQFYWDALEKHRTRVGGPGVTLGQDAEASLTNFTQAIQMLTAQIAAIAGLPPHYLGINTANPASADAIRSAESTLVERAREKHHAWSSAYVRAMRLAVAVRDGRRYADVAVDLRDLETIWREPGTRTVAQEMDAAVKAVQAGIYDTVKGQEAVGMTPGEREAMAERQRFAADTLATQQVRAQIALADELERTRGMTPNAALAAAGLFQSAALNSAETA